jgi:4-hydroxybenzoate polyprenyltransferase
MRPKHWVKNIFVFAPMFFSATISIDTLAITVFVFIAFSLIASSIYIFNDIFDRENDRQHPVKRFRPLPSGELEVPFAAVVSALLFSASFSFSFTINKNIAYLIMLYAIINILYSIWLKHIVIIDVFCVASGFILRILAGAIAANVRASPWILICTLLLALFMALGKRRHELVLLEGESTNHRIVLGEYTPYLVDQLIAVITPLTVISYVLYTLDKKTIEQFGSDYLFVTAGFVMLGVFRYLYIIHKRDLAGSPVELIFRDRPFLAIIFVWMVSILLAIY